MSDPSPKLPKNGKPFRLKTKISSKETTNNAQISSVDSNGDFEKRGACDFFLLHMKLRERERRKILDSPIRNFFTEVLMEKLIEQNAERSKQEGAVRKASSSSAQPSVIAFVFFVSNYTKNGRTNRLHFDFLAGNFFESVIKTHLKKLEKTVNTCQKSFASSRKRRND